MLSFIIDIIIKPLVFIYDLVFGIVYKMCTFFSNGDVIDYAIPIIAVSVIVNILTFPLYKRADYLQNIEREKQKEMADGIANIKKAFKGDERFFMLSTFYRQHNYKPIHALRCSLSLFLQIPFFTAAYQFFSNSNALIRQGGLFIGNNFIFPDLSLPDQMFSIGSFTINILPIIMTLINFISSYIYTKDFSFKDKIQPFLLAIIFLIFLYNSPSGLVIYWTCNNLISLIKIIYLKIKNNRIRTNKNNKVDFNLNSVCNDKHFDLIGITSIFNITLMAGVLIPLQIITSQPHNFANGYVGLWVYLENTISTYIGFALWLLLFFSMLKNNHKIVFSKIMLILTCWAIINYFVFYRSFGFLSPLLRYDERIFYIEPFFIILNIVVLIFILIALCIFFKTKFKKMIVLFSKFLLLTIIIMSLFNIFMTRHQLIFKGDESLFSSSTIMNKIDQNIISEIINSNIDIDKYTNNELFPVEPVFKLSKKGKNVILLMMDKFQSAYFPFLTHEKPILKEQLKGFTYYPNTISFGCNTIYGTPGLYGGYEYTPIEHDRNRPNELIMDNQNNALKLLPTMFHREGYDCVVSGLSCENYGENTNSIFSYNDVDDFIATKSNIAGAAISKSMIYNIDNSLAGLKRNFLYYSFMKMSPLVFQGFIYDDGKYLLANDNGEMLYDMTFINSFSALERLPDFTKIVDNESNNFMIFGNGAIHQPNMLSYPEFALLPYTDSIADKEFYDDAGNKFQGLATYFTSTMGGMLQLGNFFDYLRNNGVYDNTRIIIVADHGYAFNTGWEKYILKLSKKNLKYDKYKILDLEGRDRTNILDEDDETLSFSMLGLNPLLLFKDFNENDELKISDELMTNADTPFLLIQNLLKDQSNPFTGNIISSDYKKNNILQPTIGHHYNPEVRRNDKLYQMDNELWVTVTDNIFNSDNWCVTDYIK